MPPLTKSRYETFAQAQAEGKGLKESAIIAGYSPKNAPQQAWLLNNNPQVIIRVAELREEYLRRSIASKEEIQQTLTEILRGRAHQFVDSEGKITVSPEQANSAAVEAIETQEAWVGTGDMAQPITTTKIKLRSPVHAARELNLIQGNHAPVRYGVDEETRKGISGDLAKLMVLGGAVIDELQSGQSDVPQLDEGVPEFMSSEE